MLIYKPYHKWCMVNKEGESVFNKIKQLSNSKKFKIILLTQDKPIDITTLSKLVKIAFNKCSNYCTQLQDNDLIEKHKEGKNILIKSKIKISESSITF